MSQIAEAALMGSLAQPGGEVSSLSATTEIPTFDLGGALVDIADREQLYSVLDVD